MSGKPIKTPKRQARCHYCRTHLTKENGSKDHIVPLSRGGVDRSWNWVTACRPCNEAKGNQWPNHRCNFCHDSIRRHAAIGVTREGIDSAFVKPNRTGRSSYVKARK